MAAAHSAFGIGQPVSYAALATDLGLSPNTVKSWLSVLEASRIVFLFETCFENTGRRIAKTPKLYLLDAGLCSYLLGARTPDDLARSPMLGALFETHVLGQIVRHFANQGRRREIYFYRDHHGHEVDFLIPTAGRFQLIECTWAESPGATQRGFAELEALVGADRIVSQTIVTPDHGTRRASEAVTIADSVSVAFLSSS